MGGGTRQKPCIWFSGFWSQGDGACFEGRYAYAPRASLRIRDYAPQDTELHRIADALQALQRLNFYQLTASFRQTGRYSHAYAMTFDVDRDSPAGQAIVGRTDDDLVDALRDLAHWLYRALEREYEFQTSDETVDEGMSANGYTFTAEGRRSYALTEGRPGNSGAARRCNVLPGRPDAVVSAVRRPRKGRWPDTATPDAA